LKKRLTKGVSPVLPDVVELLQAAGAAVGVHVPQAPYELPPWLWRARVAGLRGLAPEALVAAQRLEAAGVRCCNSAAATALVADRAALHRSLVRAGVPVPAGQTVTDWAQVRALAAGSSVVVKAVSGHRGRGASVVIADASDLPGAPPFDGPYLVQERVVHDGRDRKLYVIGARVAGLLVPLSPDSGPAEAFELNSRYHDVARRCGETTGLELYGVDVLEGSAGPVVVDVNPFPSCRRVPGAARSIAEHLLARAGDTR
jgi:ribosomal protein S6--L-glutamate ligase